MRIKQNFLFPIVLLAFLCGAVATAGKRPILPPAGVIPDEVTAVRVGLAVFPPVFGEEEVNKYLPYHAVQKDEIWTVYGTIKHSSRGGTPMMRIRKMDGQVLEVWHSQ